MSQKEWVDLNNQDKESLVTEAEIHKIAHLARLKIDEAQLSVHIRNFSHILEMIAHIHDLKTQDVVPLYSSLELHHVTETNKPYLNLGLRPDTITETNQQPILQDLTLSMDENGYYLVPLFIE